MNQIPENTKTEMRQAMLPNPRKLDGPTDTNNWKWNKLKMN